MTALEEALVLTLLKLPGLRADQAARLLRLVVAAARRVLRSLKAKGLVRGIPVLLPAEEAVKGPLAAWYGHGKPDFGAVCNRTAKRWPGPLEQTTFYVATARAARIFSRTPPKLKRNSLAHDQHLAAVYLHYASLLPHRAADWMSEREVAALFPGQATPDAAISDGNGGLLLAVEVVGHYPPARLERLHRHCEALGLPYELL